jgi:hypothetical protein
MTAAAAYGTIVNDATTGGQFTIDPPRELFSSAGAQYAPRRSVRFGSCSVMVPVAGDRPSAITASSDGRARPWASAGAAHRHGGAKQGAGSRTAEAAAESVVQLARANYWTIAGT